MLTSKEYATKLEKELIDKFSKEFYEKMGYHPTVVTKIKLKDEEYINFMSLSELEEHFEEFLPNFYGKKISLKANSRIRELVELRHMFFNIAKNLGYTLKNIGIYMNNKDHTTVIHGLKTFKNLMHTDEKYKQRYLNILNKIRENGGITYYSSTMDGSDQA